MTAEMAIPSSETTKPQKVLLGSVTALAQSAWMGFALASDVLEQLRLAPSGILRRIQVIRPAIPRDISLKNLLTREYSVGEASFILMASFFLSAALGCSASGALQCPVWRQPGGKCLLRSLSSA